MRPSSVGAVAYEPESSAANWAENVSTFGTRINVIGKIDLSGLKRSKIDPQRVTQRRNEITPYIAGPKGGSFKTTHHLTGHGSTTAGAAVLTDLETLLGKVFGASAGSATAGTTAAAGGTVTALNTVAANGFVAGAIGRAGTLGDGRGNGQGFTVASHVASVLTILQALGAALNATDVIYNPVTINVNEAPTNTDIIGLRFLLQTANQCIECHGVYPKTVTFSGFNASQIPTIEIEWGVSWWDWSTAAFPSALAVQTFTPVITAGGTLFVNLVANATRPATAVRSYRDFKVTYKLGIVELKGPGGVKPEQIVVGCKRISDDCTISWTEDAEAATLTPTLAGYWDGNAQYHVLLTLSAADGSSVIFNWPYLTPSNDRPTQQDMEGLNRVTLMLDAGTGQTQTTELTSSMMRFAMG